MQQYFQSNATIEITAHIWRPTAVGLIDFVHYYAVIDELERDLAIGGVSVRLSVCLSVCLSDTHTGIESKLTSGSRSFTIELPRASSFLKTDFHTLGPSGIVW